MNSLHDFNGSHTYETASLSAATVRRATVYSYLFSNQAIEPLSMMPSTFTLLLKRDFPDPDVYNSIYFGTQTNGNMGQIQRAAMVDGEMILDKSPVLMNATSWVDTSHPQAWAPTVWQHESEAELWVSMKIKGSGMGIVRATASNFLEPFELKDVLIHGKGFRFIDQQLVRERLLNQAAGLPTNKDFDWMYYGSMFGPITAQALSEDHRSFISPPIDVLQPDPSKPVTRLIEAPIRLDYNDEKYLFVSGSGCFCYQPQKGEHYAIMQSKFNQKTLQFEYAPEDTMITLQSTPWFYNPGHPQIYRTQDDTEDTATCVFAAIPWFRDVNERLEDPHTSDEKTRYLFSCKLQIRNGWWEVAA